MGDMAVATGEAYAREVRRGALWLGVLGIVLVCAATGLLAWHNLRSASVDGETALYHHAAVGALAALQQAAQRVDAAGPGRLADDDPSRLGAVRALAALRAAQRANPGVVSPELLARVEAGWREVDAGGGPDALLRAMDELSAHHLAAAAAPETPGGPVGHGGYPGLLWPMVALIGIGGLAAHRLVRRIATAVDHQRAATESLRQAEAGHVEAQAIAHLGHWSWDIATNTSVRSAETFRILGRTPETLGPRLEDFLGVVHPDDRAGFAVRTRAARRRTGPFEMGYRVVWPDGTVRHVLSQGEVAADPRTGRPARMVGTILDVTDHKRAEEALKASERRFRDIFDSAPFGIALGDTQGRVIEVNAAFERFTGYAAEELRGRAFTELCHPDDMVPYRSLLERARSGCTGTIERRYIRKDGTVAWGRLTLGPGGDGRGPHEHAIGIVEDIGERRAMEETLREREALLRQVTESIDQVFWLKDAERQQVLYVSPAYETIHGRSVESLRASPNGWFDAIHPDDRPAVIENVRRAREKGVPYAGEYRIIRPDGTERVIHGRGYPVRDERGKVYRWAGVAADVTELHRLQSALRESEDRMRQIAETIGEVFWMEDGRMERTFYISPSYERVWGRTCESLYRNPMSWSDAVHPDDRAQVVADVLRAREAGVSHENTYRIVRPDGGERVIHARGYPVRDETGEVRRWAGVSADVTELHRLESALMANEERLREVTENIGEVFWAAEVGTGRVGYVSPAFEDVWGRSRESVYADPDVWLASIHPDDRPGVRQTVERAIETGEPYDNCYRILRPDGGERYIRDRGHPVRDPDGTVRRIVGAATDITEQRAAEEEGRRYQEQLAHVTRLATMGEIASGLAHEINQPLTAIGNYAHGTMERLRSEGRGTDDPVVQVLDQIARQATRAGDIVRHVRDLVGRGQGRRTVEDINALVASAARLMEPEARRHGVRVRMELGDAVSSVEVDRIQVDQVLINLMKNAIEALAGHPGRREVVLATDVDGGRVQVSVADTGPGLAPEEAERLFGAFVTTKPEGLGMGLAISRSIVEAHGGTLVAEAGPAGGAVFRFSVPAAREVAVG